MEKQYYKVFTGQAIDVKMVKNHLAQNGIKSFAENRSNSTGVEWNKRDFDPFMELKVESTDLEKAVKLVDEFLNTKAE
ncbi:MAG: DUF2007 domain-containing protein [Bacteroidales bacterium]|nr:DUF2007 domain-containing protein [Bacteroidales bacterium]MBR6179193.1 DUF2007 domain-containing protein [Bacteroidales bacterium]